MFVNIKWESVCCASRGSMINPFYEIIYLTIFVKRKQWFTSQISVFWKSSTQTIAVIRRFITRVDTHIPLYSTCYTFSLYDLIRKASPLILFCPLIRQWQSRKPGLKILRILTYQDSIQCCNSNAIYYKLM